VKGLALLVVQRRRAVIEPGDVVRIHLDNTPICLNTATHVATVDPDRRNVNLRLETLSRLDGMAAPDPDEAEPRRASQRVAERLARDIDAGVYGPGERLPSYRQIATDHDIAVNTAQAAVRLLAASGRAVVRPSSGAFVADEPTDAPRTTAADRLELAALRDQVRRARTVLVDVERTLGELLDRAPAPAPDSDS
jgi:DNA-binding transcriptional regulator YhcF (GntR family)